LDWWSDGTSNQFLVGEKFLADNAVGRGDSTLFADFPYICIGNHRSPGPARVMVKYFVSPDSFTVRPIAKGITRISPSTELIHDDQQGGFGSWHSGICNFVLGDGSVRSVSNTTAQKPLMSYSVVNDGTKAELP
jgi:hypothetical protein